MLLGGSHVTLGWSAVVCIMFQACYRKTCLGRAEVITLVRAKRIALASDLLLPN